MHYKTVYFLPFLLLTHSTHAQHNNRVLQNESVASAQTSEKKPIAYATDKSFVVRGNINIGLKSGDQLEMVNSLRHLLADSYVLYTKTLNFHWNIEGKLFSQLHEFFKKLYEDFEKANDLLAERIRALGGYSPGSLQEFLTLTQLKESIGQQKRLSSSEMIRILLEDLETIIRSVRQACTLSDEVNDWGTNNLLAGLIEQQEKNAWMLRAHLVK